MIAQDTETRKKVEAVDRLAPFTDHAFTDRPLPLKSAVTPHARGHHSCPQLCSSIMRAISSIETAADALSGIASSRSARSAPG